MARKKRNRSTSSVMAENAPENNISGNNSDIDINLDTDFDTLYSDEKTKEIVGSLFDEYVGEIGTNYFTDHGNSFLEESNEDEETLEESIARKRKRAVTPTKKSIVFRKKVKKVSDEDTYDDENDDEALEANEDIDDADETNPLEKTIILPKLSNFFKKSDRDEYVDEDEEDDIDEFFAGLKKDSIARAQSAAAKEHGKPVLEEEPEEFDEEEETPKITSEPSKPREIHIKDRNPEESRPFENLYTSKKRVNPEDIEDDEDEEEQIVEIGIAKIILCALLIISVFIITALAYKNHSYSKQLEEARSQITELQKNNSSTYETELEELKKQVSELTAENESLKSASGTASDPHTAAVEILSEAQNEISTQAPVDNNLSQQESSGNTYTVKSGDTFWKISQSVYGNGADFQKILDANGLNENSVLNEGQVLKIPN